MRYLIILVSLLVFPYVSYSQCDFTIETIQTVGCMQSQSEAVFTDLVKTEFDGTTVTKTDKKNKWDAGAFSTAGIWNNGYAETVITQTDKSRIFGLAPTNNANSNKVDDIEYAIVLRDWGGGEIRESGSYKASIANYSIDDKFKIAIEDGILRYYQNNTLLYESTAVPSLPQYVDLAFEDKNSEIKDVKIVNTTIAKIRAFTDQDPSTISSYEWYQNDVQLSETGSELTLSGFSDGDIINCIVTPNSGSCSGTTLYSNIMQVYANGTMPESDLYITATPADQGCYLAEQGLVWHANIPANILINENSVKKTQGYNTSNGGVYSENTIVNNGYLEFQTSNPNSRKMLGLSSADNGSSESTIQFAFYIESNGKLKVYENGSWKGEFAIITSSDKMRISIENNIVKYYLNSSLLYVSEQAPSLPLIADGTIQDINGSFVNTIIANPTHGIFTAHGSDADNPSLTWKVNGVTNETIGTTLSLEDLSEDDIITCSFTSMSIGCGSQELVSNSIKILPISSISQDLFYIEGFIPTSAVGMAEEDLIWNPESMANVAIVDNELIKTQGYNQYNAGASSLNTVKNNGYFEYIVNETGKNKTIGLSATDANYSYNSTDYAMVLSSDGKFTIYESNSWKLGNQSYSIGDILRIAVENNTVKYYRNGTIVYTSGATPNLPLLVDVALSDMGASIEDGIVANENSGKFISHITSLGSSPAIDWLVNGVSIGVYSANLDLGDIENNDLITCKITPDFDGCNNNSSYVSNSIKFNGPISLTDWIGNVSSEWDDALNWSEGVPNQSLSAHIPANRDNWPEINTSQDVKNITVESEAELEVKKNGHLLVYGNLLSDGKFDADKGSVTFKGNKNQTIKGSSLEFKNLSIDLANAENQVLLLSTIKIDDKAEFINGTINAQDHAVVFLKDAITTSGNSNSYINGLAYKQGKNDFEFPIGANGIYAPITISAPRNKNDEFCAQYYSSDPNLNGYYKENKDASLNQVSTCEYWELQRTNGSSDVYVSLSYQDERSCGVSDPEFLQIAHWNGMSWENKGMSALSTVSAINSNASNASDANSGNIKSLYPISDFSPFTLGSRSPINPLPIELYSFSAEVQGSKTELKWITESELNNSYFTLERSVDARYFQEIASVDGAGTSKQRLDYQFTDNVPKAGINYYRLSQTDFDGQKTYFDIKSVNFEFNIEIAIYPNPNKGEFTIVRGNENPVHMRVLDTNGRTVWVGDTDEVLTQVGLYHLSDGMYYLNIDDGINQITEKIIIK